MPRRTTPPLPSTVESDAPDASGPDDPAVASAEKLQQMAHAMSGVADSITQRSQRRFERGEITGEEARARFGEASLLRSHADLLFAASNDGVIDRIDEPVRSLLEAIEVAKERMESLDETRHQLLVFASLVTLVGAVLGGDVKAVGEAVKGVREASRKR